MKIFILLIWFFLLFPASSFGEVKGNWSKQVSLSFPEAEIIGPNTVRIPFRLSDRLILVQAGVDTLKGNFVLDTGAEGLVLNARHFEGERLQAAASGGVTGGVRRVYLREMEEMTWGLLTYLDLEADVIDLSHIEYKKNIRLLGLIGYELLKDFEIFIDFQLRQLTLRRLDRKGRRLDTLPLLEQPSDSMDIQVIRYVIVLPSEVGGKKVAFSLDTGAEVNLLDRRINRRVLDHFEILKRVKLNGTGPNSVEVLAGRLGSVRCGPVNCRPMQTLLTNLDDIQDVYGFSLDGVLGFEFLFRRRVAINYRRKMLYFYPWYKRNEQRP